jgi:methionyl-tRNA formyltransferase
MRVLFIGSPLSGSSCLASVARRADVAGVIELAQDDVDPAFGVSLIETARALSWPFLVARGDDPRTESFVSATRPELIVTVGDRSLIAAELCAEIPAVRLHPGFVPSWRGHHALQRAIAAGERELGATALWDDGQHGGATIAERRARMTSEQDVGDAIEMLEPLFGDLTSDVLALASSGFLARDARGPLGQARSNKEEPVARRIDWTQDSETVMNQVRALSRPFPGAFSEIGGGRVTIWRARAGMPQGPGAVGAIWRADGKRFYVNCGEGSLEVLDADWTDRAAPRVGESFEALERAA